MLPRQCLPVNKVLLGRAHLPHRSDGLSELRSSWLRLRTRPVEPALLLAPLSFSNAIA